VTAEPSAFSSIGDILAAFRRRLLSPLELADLCLARIREGDSLKAFITPPGDAARREARRCEARLLRGDEAPLLGIPIAIKDLFATRGLRTTAGSRIVRDWVPERDAAAVERLKAAGAVIFGKTNLHEFAYGVSTANPWFGIARNPHNQERSPGGSSGGSAIAVVFGMCPAALGSDTGGSIRIPASLCGCVGLKPTYGAIPLDGTMPLAWTLDHAGPLTRTVDDAGLMFDVLSGTGAWQQARRRRRRAGIRIGLVRSPLLDQVDPAVRNANESAARKLSRLGARLRRVTIPELEWTVATQLVTLRAEASAVHHRWLRSRLRDYGTDVRARLQLGSLISATDYVLAQRMRARVRAALGTALQDVDVLMLPTTPITAPVIGNRSIRWGSLDEPTDGALVRLTAPFNLAGVPALSLPIGQHRGLPIGLQIAGRWNDEAGVLSAGRLVEEASR
jgi:aspartyl-tRNA(Asn)/glutamyl-tRNA(Gln) amidotransferase subunit A